VGFAEWIAWRLDKYSTDPVLFYAIEAVWAGILDWKYLRPLNEVRKASGRGKWQGAERGPLWAAFHLLGEAVSLVRRKMPSSPESACLSQLALHVMPEPKPFKDWRRYVIQRLTDMYPMQKEDMLGPPLPKEVLYPNFNYKPDMASELLSKFLCNLDYTQNPFLNSPDDMIEAGFNGTPYSL
jgi:hypothetical protein